MYRHLLVTVDGAPGGIDAIGHALELARAVGARVTFVLPGATPDSRLSGARLPEHGAKVEAAARAQGLSHAIAAAGDTSPGTLAGELGCDLIGMAALPPHADAAECRQRLRLLAMCGVPVLVCASPRPPAAARVIARCLDAHRAVTAMLHELIAHGGEAAEMAAAEPSAAHETIDIRGTLAALAALQRARFGSAAEAQLFAALRTRTESVAAELDELDRQQRRDAQALDALARIASDGLPSPAFDTALARYAHGAFEQMGRMEGVIFPAARRYLGDADWAELDRRLAGGAAATPPGANEPDDARRASD
ncbi:universal stress protein [Burkholderia pyrrocinia]|uniref:universal stress protein n=1 Tax=Burkholderia pyrrocinia TaxID=60550 RepID=UPI00157529EC|nr:universal stress protein [Burkholderia pyrrocinia]NTX32694.1 universal stress protein [Burkholderia pyrrocinia]